MARVYLHLQKVLRSSAPSFTQVDRRGGAYLAIPPASSSSRPSAHFPNTSTKRTVILTPIYKRVRQAIIYQENQGCYHVIVRPQRQPYYFKTRACGGALGLSVSSTMMRGSRPIPSDESPSCSARSKLTDFTRKAKRKENKGTTKTCTDKKKAKSPSGDATYLLRSERAGHLHPLTGLPIKSALVGTQVCSLLRDINRAALFLSSARRRLRPLFSCLSGKPPLENPWFST